MADELPPLARCAFLALALGLAITAIGPLFQALDTVDVVHQWHAEGEAKAQNQGGWVPDHAYADAGMRLAAHGDTLMLAGAAGLLVLAWKDHLPKTHRRAVRHATLLVGVAVLVGFVGRHLTDASPQRVGTPLLAALGGAVYVALAWPAPRARLLALLGVGGLVAWQGLVQHAANAYVAATAAGHHPFEEVTWWMIAPHLSAATGWLLLAAAFLVASQPARLGRTPLTGAAGGPARPAHPDVPE